MRTVSGWYLTYNYTSYHYWWGVNNCIPWHMLLKSKIKFKWNETVNTRGEILFRQLQWYYFLNEIFHIEKNICLYLGFIMLECFCHFFFSLIFGFYSTTWGQKMGDNVSPLESLYHNQVQKI